MRGLPAKPRIDINLVVADTTDEDAYVPPLEAIGYELRIREPDWYEHRMLRGDTCLMEATDIRVWGVHPIANPERLQALPIPEEVRALLSRP